MTPTPEQVAAIEFASLDERNLMISALAGAAKTSTLIMIAKALPSTRILALAFNKAIATEMQERLPINCDALTMNALGHRVWSDSISKRYLKVVGGKMYGIVKELVEALPQKEKDEAYESFSDTLRALDKAKTVGYIPDGIYPNAKRLQDDTTFFALLPEEPTDLQITLIRRAMQISLDQAMTGTIDFNDQILMPTVFHGAFPSYPLVLIDEAQDLNPLQHQLLTKLARKRIIAVGDRCQAIYGFRGADQNSMDNLQSRFSMHELTLSVSFRCPKTVIREARWRAPRMQWPEWAEEGTVSRPPHPTISSIPDGAAIICRNNAPLFSMALKLLAAGRFPEIVGKDLVKNLLKILERLIKKASTRDELLAAIDRYQETKSVRSRDRDSLEDQCECLRIFARAADSARGAYAFAESILSRDGHIKLMTGHKAKGLEFDHVFFLDQFRINLDYEQDRNLQYVIQTRAKKTLTYINLDQFMEENHAD